MNKYKQKTKIIWLYKWRSGIGSIPTQDNSLSYLQKIVLSLSIR